MIQLSHLDRLALTVRDLGGSCRVDAEAPGMEVATSAGGRKALRVSRQKINLHQRGRAFEPKAAAPVAGSADLCCVTGQPLAEGMAHLAARRAPVIDGPAPGTGARGPILPVYCRDAEGHLIEISNALSGSG